MLTAASIAKTLPDDHIVRKHPKKAALYIWSINGTTKAVGSLTKIDEYVKGWTALPAEGEL